MRLVALPVIAVVVGLMISTLALDPASAVGSTPSPPHQFYGLHPETPITIDGEAAPDGSVVMAHSGAGAVVGDAVVHNGTWLITVEAAIDVVWFELNGMAADGDYAVQSGGLSAVPLEVRELAVAGTESGAGEEQPAGNAETTGVDDYLSFDLLPGWNAISYPGSGVAAATLSAELGGATLMRWNADAQTWDIYDPRLPDPINGLREIERGTSLWVKSAVAQQIKLVIAPEPTLGRVLHVGWNLVTWEGHAVNPELAFEGLLSRIGGVFLYEAESGTFRTFLPGVAVYLSNLDLLPRGMPVWVLVTEGPALEWNSWQGDDAV